MLRYILQRIAYMFLSLFVITTITFFMMHSIPGNPLETEARRLPPEVKANYFAKYGFDKPLHEQYGIFLKNLVLHQDLGMSFKYPGRTVMEIIGDHAPISGRVGIQALAIGITFGILLGIVAALNKGRWPDYVISVVAILGITIPVFIMASLLQAFFSLKLRMFPSQGWGTFQHTVIPSLAMCFGSLAVYSRYMKSNILEVMGQDYIMTAEAKGVSRFNIIWSHILRNAILPVITILGPQIAGIFTGSFIVERMFAIPGLGFYYVSAIQTRDYTLIIGTTIFYAALFVISQLFVDIMYGVVDPRIRLSGDN